MDANGGERLREQAPAVVVDLGDDLLQRLLSRRQVVELNLQGASAGLQLVQLLERLHVDVAETAQLLLQLLDLAFGRRRFGNIAGRRFLHRGGLGLQGAFGDGLFVQGGEVELVFLL